MPAYIDEDRLWTCALCYTLATANDAPAFLRSLQRRLTELERKVERLEHPWTILR